MQSLPTDEAVKLFQAWSKSEDDTKPVQRICELTGGLPLAVRLAGKYIFETGEPVSEYLEDLENTPLEELNQGDRKLESVPVLLKRSLNQVSDNAISIIGIAGILAFSSFSKEVIQAAMPDIPIKKPINELNNYGLLNRIDKRFIISHALIHTYARENHNPDNKVIERISEYYNSYAREYREQGPKGYEVLDKEKKHIMRVTEECKTRKIWQWVNELVWAVGNIGGYFYTCGYWVEHKAALTLGIYAAKKTHDIKSQCEFLNNLGVTYRNLGQTIESIKLFKQSLKISDRLVKDKILSNLGNAYCDLGQTEKAIKCYEKALSVGRYIGSKHRESSILGNMGNAFYAYGQLLKAIECYDKALSISREIGARKDEGIWLGNIGVLYRDLGQTEKAIEYCEQALSISRDIGHMKNEANQLNILGSVYCDLGETEKAIEYYKKSHSICREIGHRHGEVICLSNLGKAYTDLTT